MLTLRISQQLRLTQLEFSFCQNHDLINHVVTIIIPKQLALGVHGRVELKMIIVLIGKTLETAVLNIV